MQSPAQSFNICVECQTAGPLNAELCAQCGHPYPTQITPAQTTPTQTSPVQSTPTQIIRPLAAFIPPSLEADPQGLPITAVATGLVIASFLLAVLTITRVASAPLLIPQSATAQSALTYQADSMPLPSNGADVQAVSTAMKGGVWVLAPLPAPTSPSSFTPQFSGAHSSIQPGKEADIFQNTFFVSPYAQSGLTLPTGNTFSRPLINKYIIK